MRESVAEDVTQDRPPSWSPLALVALADLVAGLVLVLIGVIVLPDVITVGSVSNTEVVGGPAYASLYTGSAGRGWFARGGALALVGLSGVVWARRRSSRLQGPEGGGVVRLGRTGRVGLLVSWIGLLMLVAGLVLIPRSAEAFGLGGADGSGVVPGRAWLEIGTGLAVLGAAVLTGLAFSSRRRRARARAAPAPAGPRNDA